MFYKIPRGTLHYSCDTTSGLWELGGDLWLMGFWRFESLEWRFCCPVAGGWGLSFGVGGAGMRPRVGLLLEGCKGLSVTKG